MSLSRKIALAVLLILAALAGRQAIDGVADAIKGAIGIPAAQAQVSDAYTVGQAAPVATLNLGYNGSAWDQLRAGGNNADAVAVTSLGVLDTTTFPLLWNGTTWDRWKAVSASVSGSTPNGTAIVSAYMGTSKTVNLTAATNVKGTQGRLFKVVVLAAGSTASTVCDNTTACAAANIILSIPSTATVGQIYDLNAPMTAGIRVEPGTSASLAVIYN